MPGGTQGTPIPDEKELFPLRICIKLIPFFLLTHLVIAVLLHDIYTHDQIDLWVVRFLGYPSPSIYIHKAFLKNYQIEGKSSPERISWILISIVTTVQCNVIITVREGRESAFDCCEQIQFLF